MDVFEFLNPVMKTSRWFGLAPLTQTCNTRKYQFSRPWLLYTFLFITCHFAIEMMIKFDPSVGSREVVLNATSGVVGPLTFVLALGMNFSSLLHVTNLISLVNKLASLVPPKLTHKYSRIEKKSVSYVCVGLVLTVTAFTFSFRNAYSSSRLNSYLLTISGNARYLLVILPYQQLVHFLIIFEEHFSFINSEIETIFLGMKEIPQHSQQREGVTYRRGGITPLSNLHHQLCELARQLNRIYCVQVTTMVAMALLQVTICSYLDIRLLNTISRQDPKMAVIYAMNVWNFIFTAKLTLLLVLCGRVSSQVSDSFTFKLYV